MEIPGITTIMGGMGNTIRGDEGPGLDDVKQCNAS